jgi:hypothetical protein
MQLPKRLAQMKGLNTRFALAIALVVGLVSVAALHSGGGADAIAEVAQPIEAAAKTVIETTEAARDFGAYMPGSFK